MLNRLRQDSLKIRLLLLAAVLIILGIMGLALRVSAVLQGELEELLSGQLSATVGYVAADVEHEIGFHIKALNDIAAAITPELIADPARVQRYLTQGKVSRLLFSPGLSVANKEGRVVADEPSQDGRLGSSIKDQRFFHEIMAGNKLYLGISAPGSFSKQPIVAIAVPIFDALGAPAGILVSTVLPSDSALFGQMQQTRLGRTGFSLVISPKDSLIISATDKSRVFSPLPARGVNPLMDRRLAEGFEGAARTIDSSGTQVLTVSRNLKDTGWMVVAGISTAEAFAPIVKLKQEIFLAALLLSLTVVVILGLVLRKQLRPLDEAAIAMERMGTGEQDLSPLPIGRDDEIGRLIKSFNALVAQCNRLHEASREELDERKRKEDEVRGLNNTLEERVELRAKELLEINHRLLDEIRYRQFAETTVSDFAIRLQIMSRRLANTHESESRRLARELHDRVSSSLTAVGLNLELMEKQLPRDTAAKISERLSDTADLVRETLFVCRDISSDLHPAILDYEGVFGALEDYVLKFRARTGLDVVVSGNGRETPLSPDKEIALFRIAQEALTNCAKHADAHTVTIALNGDAERMELVIADDGSGLDLRQLGRREKGSGLGMLSMRERADAVGGKFRMESTPGSGMRIIVEV